MNKQEQIKSLINEKLEKYFLLTKLDKSFNYKFNGPYNNFYGYIKNYNGRISIKYILSGFKLGEIQFDVLLNIIIDSEIVINNENLLFSEKLQNISDYLDYICETENNLDFKKEDEN